MLSFNFAFDHRTSALLLAAVTVATSLVGNAAAFAAKRVSYEEAWRLCKAELDREKIPGTLTSTNERYLRGGACMKRYGHNF